MMRSIAMGDLPKHGFDAERHLLGGEALGDGASALFAQPLRFAGISEQPLQSLSQ